MTSKAVKKLAQEYIEGKSGTPAGREAMRIAFIAGYDAAVNFANKQNSMFSGVDMSKAVVTWPKPDEETDKCTCDIEYEEHTCPFSEEIHDDHESLCTCCPYCEHNCAMDV